MKRGASCITCEDVIILESPKRLVSIIKLVRNVYQRLLYFYHKDDESKFMTSNILAKFANLPFFDYSITALCLGIKSDFSFINLPVLHCFFNIARGFAFCELASFYEFIYKVPFFDVIPVLSGKPVKYIHKDLQF